MLYKNSFFHSLTFLD